VPALAIPKEYERGIAVIKSLSDSDVSQISEVLKKASPASDSANIASALLPLLRQNSDDAEKLTDVIFSLYFLRSHLDVSVDRFLESLIEAIKESENSDIQTADPDELANLKSKFKSLLTVHPLSTRAKAHGLQNDFANIFWDAKIISDIRPVWDGNVTEPPEGIVITQTLKLEYRHASGREELYMRVDKGDIENLISVLKRAQDKMVTLESLAKSDWMKILDE
jgi:mRNA-degrading endonuclease YafQ of YafQ-DinJ toxin-antitoxin module